MSPAAPASKRVLIVDDNIAYLDLLTELMLRMSRGALEVVTAQNAGKALSILREKLIHLVVADARMPVVDGVQLIRLIRQRHPLIPIAVLTSYADEATRTACLEGGADLFLEKPHSAEGIETLLVALEELMRSTPEEGFRGVLDQIDLQDLLQIECSKRHSCRIDVRTRNGRGGIFIKEGAVNHAQAGELVGADAFFHLLSLKGGELRVLPYAEPPDTTITASWMSLLMEWAQKRDELHPAAQETRKPGDTSLLRGDAAEPTPAEPLPAELAAAPLSAAERRPLPERVVEMFLCSETGEVLYEQGCVDFLARKRLLDFIGAKSGWLAAHWPLGNPELAEFQTSRGRCAAKVLADVAVFVTVQTAAEAPAVGPPAPAGPAHA